MANPFVKGSAIFKTQIIGVEKVSIRLLDLSDRIRKLVRDVCRIESKSVMYEARNNAARVVLTRTGTLNNSIRAKTFAKGDMIGASVSSKWYIFRFFEKGYGGGREFPIKGYLREGHYVQSHFRKINMPARPILMPAFNAHRGRIREALERAIREIRGL